jgi:ribosome-associated translation inhibitor RaiA
MSAMRCGPRREGHFDAVVKKYFDGNYSGHLTLEPEGSGFNAQCMVHLDSGAVLQSSAYGGDAHVGLSKCMADARSRSGCAATTGN